MPTAASSFAAGTASKVRSAKARSIRVWSVRAAVVGVALVLACLLLAPPESAMAQQTAGQEFASRARHAVLMDAETGAVMYQHKANDLVPPASMSKLMTIAMVFKALKTGQLKLDDQIHVSENAWRRGGAPSRTSAMLIPINTKVPLDEILQGIIVQSGNDAAIAVAENLAGTETEFARLMTEEARRIGLKSSQFRNATGLSHPEHRMTARELADLARHLIREHPDMYTRFGQREFAWRRHKFYNRNPLLAGTLGVDGLKTGHLAEAGYGLVASGVQDGRRLIAVVMGLPTENDRRDESRRMLEWGFRNVTEAKLFDAGETVGHARVWGGDKLHVALQGKGDVAIVLAKFPASQKLKGDIIYQGPLKPPIRKGDQVATLRVTSSSGASNEVPLYAAEDIGHGGMIRRGLDSLAHLAERAIGAAIVRARDAALKPSADTAEQPASAARP